MDGSEALKEILMQDFVQTLNGGSRPQLAKIAAVELNKVSKENAEKQNQVFAYLKDNYPEETLSWVKGTTIWAKKLVPLDDIKMNRRPGGAREMDKCKNIAKAVKAGDKMDPVVLVKLPDGTLKIADGYHRTLGFKHAEKEKIEAWVGTVQEEKGTWDKEMHEKKLNKGPLPKTADELDLGLAKVAGVFGAAKGFIGGVTGVGKKKATNALAKAEKERDAHLGVMGDFTKMEGLVKNKVPQQSIPMNERYDMARASANMQARTNKLKDNVSAAEKSLSSAKTNQVLSRGVAGVGVAGGVGVHEYNKSVNEQKNPMQLAPQIPTPVVQPPATNPYFMNQVASKQSYGLAKIAKKK